MASTKITNPRTPKQRFRIGQQVETECGPATVTKARFFKGRLMRSERHRNLIRGNRGWYYHFTVTKDTELYMDGAWQAHCKVGEKSGDWEELIRGRRIGRNLRIAGDTKKVLSTPPRAKPQERRYERRWI